MTHQNLRVSAQLGPAGTLRTWTGLLAFIAAACAREPEHPPWQCNQDHVCDPDENQTSCPSDCVWSEATGEGPAAEVCDAQENWTFVEACLETCGNGQEDEGETEETCPRDFPGPLCGDGVCDPDENAAVCDEDCEPGCVSGDGVMDRVRDTQADR